MRVEADRNFGSRECPSCGIEVAVNENRCPVCGYEFPNVPEPPKGIAVIAWIIFGIVIAAIVSMLMFGR
jgi:predicted amidophosphoribosyltransferase